MPHIPDLTPLNTVEGQMDFIRHSWQQLAALAWNEFIKRGIGAIVIDFTTAMNPRPNIYQAKAFYLALEEEPPKRLEDFTIAEETAMMREYDPQQQVIFICLAPDGNFYSSVVLAEPPPPECFLARYVKAPPLSVEAVLLN